MGATKGTIVKKKKRAPAGTADIENAKSAYLRELAFEVLYRARDRVRTGKPIDESDREYISLRLEDLGNREYNKFSALLHNKPIKFRAFLADYLQTSLRLTLDQAVAAAAGEYSCSAVRRAVIRLRVARRKRWRKK